MIDLQARGGRLYLFIAVLEIEDVKIYFLSIDLLTSILKMQFNLFYFKKPLTHFQERFVTSKIR